MVLDLRLARIECRETNNPSFLYINIHFYSNVFAKPNEQNDACIKSAMARKGGCEETNVFYKQKAKPNSLNYAEKRMPKV